MAASRNNALQSADQVTFGVPVTPPTEVLGDFSEFTMTPEWGEARTKRAKNGMLVPANDSIIGFYGATASGTMEDPSYEGMVAPLDSLFGKVAPTTTANNTKQRIHAAPLATVPTPLLRTLLYGENVAGGATMQMNDSSVNVLRISGENAGAPSVSTDWLGSKIVSGPALAALALRTNDVGLIGCHAENGLFIDEWTGTIGTTVLTNAAYSYELSVSANRKYRGFLGNCSAVAGTDSEWEGTLRLSLEVTAATKAMLAAMLPNQVLKKQIRIVYSVGTGANTRKFQIDFTGHAIVPPSLFSEREEQNAFDLTFTGVYHNTFGNWLKITTETGLA